MNFLNAFFIKNKGSISIAFSTVIKSSIQKNALGMNRKNDKIIK